MVFFQFPENGADDGFAEKLGLVGDFVFGAEIFNSLIFSIVKYQYLPVLAPCGAENMLFVSRVFHKELSSCCKVTKKNGITQHSRSKFFVSFAA